MTTRAKTTQEKLVTAGLLAGVTMLVGGAETAVAGIVISAGPAQYFDFGTGVSAAKFSNFNNLPALPGTLTNSGEDVRAFQQFDGNLGTLTKVTVEIASTNASSGDRGSYGGNVTINNGQGFDSTDEAIYTTFSATNTVAFSVTIAGGSPITVSPGFTPFSTSCQPALDEPCFSNDSDDAFTPSLIYTYTASLAPFIGTGTFAVTPAVSISALFDATNPEASPAPIDSVTFSASGFFEGFATVEYEYEVDQAPNPAPLPGTLALLATGLAGWGAARRKRTT